MAKVKELRSIIYRKFDSEAQLSSLLGWKRQKLNKITNGQKEPNLTEINELAIALHMTVEEIAQIFLRNKSPNEQHQIKGG